MREALRDGVGSLSPVGEPPALSTYWIDRALAALSREAPTDAEIASGNAWSLIRRGDTVAVRFDYSDEGEPERETIDVDELVAGLNAYREAVVQAIEAGHQLDGRWWAQRNP